MLWAPVEVLAGGLVVVDVVGVSALVVVLDVAALAIAAPPPATAPVTASVVRMDLILWLNMFTSFGGLTEGSPPNL